MKADEKKVLYSILKIISDNYYGYSSPDFSSMPEFTDDKLPYINEQYILEHSSASSMEDICAKICSCTKCRLFSTRKNTVPGMGVNNPAVLIIGEGPGEEEDKQGLPFVGPAGKLLDKMLAAIELDRNINCFITNIVKCRPPYNRNPAQDEAQACRPFLEEQIEILKPAMILGAGRVAAQNLLNTDASVGKLRGRFYNYKNIPVLITYHPSALLRNTDLKRPAWEDLKFFRRKLLDLVPDYAINFVKKN